MVSALTATPRVSRITCRDYFGTILAILTSGLGITEYTEFQFRKERS